MTELKKNDIIEAVAEGYSADGGGVFRAAGRAVFVPRALPGERWRVRIVKANRTAVWGRGEELLTPSPHRVTPPCPYYGKCGGCACMHMDYDAELAFKQDRVTETLRRIGGLDVPCAPILGAASLYAGRNKAVYNFAPGPVRGFYRARSHDVIAVERCLLQPESFDRAAAALAAWMRENNLPVYDETTGRGLVRHLFLREGDDGLQACVVSARVLPNTVADALCAACPEIISVLVCVNDRPGNTVLGPDLRVIRGGPDITVSLLGAKFSLSPLSFFQVNTPQAARLYELVRAFARPEGQVVLDLYCGVGSIGQSIARDARRLIGNDIVPAAIENARENARRNGLSRAEYHCGDAADIAARLAAEGLRPDVIIADPPRRGMDEPVLDAIARMSPARLVCVSCDPATLARDLSRLRVLGYSPRHIAPVDMFPRTRHIETVCLLAHT